MIGFKIDEVMSGIHYFLDDPEAKSDFEFRVTWGTDNLKEWINPLGGKFLVSYLIGTISVAGLCIDAPVSGVLKLRYLQDAKIIYDFAFEVDSVSYHYLGEKVNIKPWNLLTSHTTCFGTITSDDRLISRSVAYFKTRAIPAFLKSFRIVR